MDLTPQRDRAIYIASVSPSYAEYVQAGQCERPMPDGLDVSDLNFLDPQSQLFHVTHVMHSAGQVLTGKQKPCIISERDRSKTVMIADSGGFQIIGGNLPWEGDKTREKVLRWQEAHADWAMTLDIPTRSIENLNSGYKNFKDCLNTTLENLKPN